jgi:hypothetical protein
LKHNRWPGPDDTEDSNADGWTTSRLPQWFINKRAFAPKFTFEPPVADEEQSIPSDMPS